MARTKKAADEVAQPRGDIREVNIARIKHDDPHPVAIYRGEAPEKGEAIRIVLGNGVTYTGTVAEVTEADGEVMIEFVNGIAPV